MNRFSYLLFFASIITVSSYFLFIDLSPVSAVSCDTSGCSTSLDCGSGSESFSCSRPDGKNCGCGSGGASTCTYGDGQCVSGTVSYSEGCNQDTGFGYLICNNGCDCGGNACSSPKGSFDGADCNTFSGWTCDKDSYATPLRVNFYDGSLGGGGTKIGEITSNAYRSDIVSACGGYGAHAFFFNTPSSIKDGNNHAIYVYALDNDGVCSNTLLPNSPKNITCLVPTPTRIPTVTPIPTRIPTATPTTHPFITLTPTATPTPNLSCEITDPPGTAPIPIQQGDSIDLLATVTYTGLKPLTYNWTRTCGVVTGSTTNATFTASAGVGNECQVILTVTENGGLLSDQCDKFFSITGTGTGIISGYVLTDRGTTCMRDGLDSSLSGKLVELRGSVSPGSTTTDSSGYFSFIKPVGNIYDLVYTLSPLEQPSPSCALPVRTGDELTYSDLTVVSSGLDERNFYISPGGSPSNLAWIQVNAGDVHSNSTLQLNIPSGRYFSDVENSLVTSFTDAYFDANYNRPEQSTRGVRGNRWYATYGNYIANAQLANKFFDYFIFRRPPEATISGTVLDQDLFVDNNIDFNNKRIPMIGDGDISNASDVSVSSVNLPAGYTNVFYVNDNLNINNSITLSDDSVAIFVVKGNLNIDSSVTRLDGVFFVDGIVNTRGTAVATNALTVNGMLYSSSTGKIFGRSRDLGSGNANPAELINFQPKYLLNQRLLEMFGKKEYIWQEVPG